MKTATFRIVLFLLLSIAAFAKGATIGIYAVIDQLSFEPSDSTPNLVRISGVFVVPVPMSSGMYKAPQRGFVYFRIPPGMEEQVRKELAELKTYVGTHRAIGFAQYWVANPSDRWGNPHHSLEVHVYSYGESASPSDYPIPHAGGIFTNAGPDDPNFDKIAAQLQTLER
jgi:hypothetical protein